MQGLYIDWSKWHWTPELLNYFWVWSWFGEWKMDVTSVLKMLPEVMMLVPGCAGTVVSSTSLLTGLLHKEWRVPAFVLLSNFLFTFFFLMDCQNSQSSLISKGNVELKELKKTQSKHNRGLPHFRLVSVPCHTLLLLSVRHLFKCVYKFSETDLAG